MSNPITLFNAFIDDVTPEEFVIYEKQRVLLLKLVGGLINVEQFDKEFDALILEKRALDNK